MNGLVTSLWGIGVHSPQDVVTLTAALAGLAWVYVNLLRPALVIFKHGAQVVVKTAQALGVLDELPGWMKKHDADRAAIEAELGIVHARVTKIENVVAAMGRELDIDVRCEERRDVDGLSESA